ncbi:hypothetical protein HHL22_03910 [Hymenobacter sp. RP-2-7]|uniref:Phage integrase SAM-like domain-containing protein n=1 Tax=Hymenobacter polaris TaxID=2682546 RepID=A0A7Y0ABN0_9BACT|nr:hypothetical protein [Hymenobacter polaris]NML64343.1 hypothetical protein [Hymenobacter polaris]
MPPLPAPPPPTFTSYYDQWLGEQSRQMDLRTGQRLSKVYLDSLANTLAVLLEFSQATGHELTLLGMTKAFYQRGQECFFQQRGQGLNTFGKHSWGFKTFLAWCKDNGLEVSSKWHKLEAPDEPTGTDALTQAELLAIAALDFYTAEARELVCQGFASFDEQASQQPRRRGQRRSQVADYRVPERLRTLERARDKFLHAPTWACASPMLTAWPRASWTTCTTSCASRPARPRRCA